MKTAAGRVAGMATTIFATMTEMAQRCGAINLGQGFPDAPAPDFVKDAAVEALRADHNQYAPGLGLPVLRQSLAACYRQRYGLDFDPDREVLVTVGATEALSAVMLGLLDPGDEVILFDPCYDSYRPAIAFAGGVARSLPLLPPHWQFSESDLESLISERTRLLVLNSPQNPNGKVFSAAELQILANVCRRHDLLAVCDEVYEHICFDQNRHLPLARQPGMQERTLTISSLGKTFSVTGWKIGWIVGPAEPLRAVNLAKQFATFCAATPLQQAAAGILLTREDYFSQLAADYQQRRDFLFDQLTTAGLQPFLPQGSYFIMADVSSAGYADDMEFCRALPEKIGVAAIPASAFYADPQLGQQWVRFAFCKSWPLLEEAGQRLQKLSQE